MTKAPGQRIAEIFLLATLLPALVLALVACDQEDARSAAGQATGDYQPVRLPLLRLPTAGEAVVFYGDSLTIGQSASPMKGYAWLVAAQFGWRPLIQAASGTGFVSPGRRKVGSYLDRLAVAGQDPGPRLVVLQGGISDAGLPLSGYTDKVQNTIIRARQVWPKAEIVVFGLLPTSVPYDPLLDKVNASLSTAARRTDTYYISPIGREWFTRENVSRYVDKSTGQPSTEGHAYIAQCVDKVLAEFARSGQDMSNPY